MKEIVIVIGLGQLGRTFAAGFETAGKSVVGVARGESIAEICAAHPQASTVLVAVGEDDLAAALQDIPPTHKRKVALLQNELRPDQWQPYLEQTPVVAVIWFEKKGDSPPHVLLPSPLYDVENPAAGAALRESFAALDIPYAALTSRAALHFELLLKNLYILGLNLTGLRTEGTAGQLLTEHRAQFELVVSEVLLIEDALFAEAGVAHMSARRDDLLQGLERAILADENHGCKGRSAPRRLERLLAHARRLSLSCPTLQSLHASLLQGDA